MRFITALLNATIVAAALVVSSDAAAAGAATNVVKKPYSGKRSHQQYRHTHNHHHKHHNRYLHQRKVQKLNQQQVAQSSTSSPKLRLTYFDINFALGEPIRMSLAYGGIPFEDSRITFEQWPALKTSGKFPFENLPLLEIEDNAGNKHSVSQSTAILRYAGKLSGLYPSSPIDALKVDEAIDGVSDLRGLMYAAKKLPTEEEQLADRKNFCEKDVPFYFSRFEKRIKKNGGFFGITGRLTIADLVLDTFCVSMLSGFWPGISKDVIDKYPEVAKLRRHLAKNDKIKKYRESLNKKQ